MYLLSGLQLFAFITYLYLGIYVLVINPRERLNHACVCTIACLAVWSLEHNVVHFPNTPYLTALTWIKFGALGWIGLPPAMLWFAHIFSGHSQRLKTIHYHCLTTAPFLLLYFAQWHWMIVDDIHPMPYGWTHTFSDSIWPLLLCLYYIGGVGWSIFLLIRYTRKIQRQALKNLANILIAIFVSLLVVGFITDIILPMYFINLVPPMTPMLALIWAAGITYAMAKYKFLTISPAMAAPNILDTMSDLLILCDPQGNIVTVNAAAGQLLGQLPNKLEGQAFQHFIAEDNLAEKQEFLACFGSRSVENVRLNLNTPNGSTVPVILSCSLLKDGIGELAGTVTVAKDITALNQAELALRASQERYRDLVENLNDVIYSLNAEGALTYVSPRVTSVFGYLPAELVGKPIQTYLLEDDRERITQRFDEVVKGRFGASNFQLIKKDGSLAWVRASARPIRQSGKIIGLRGVITDISRQIATAEELHQLEARLHRAQKMEAIGTLAGGVAHDLNNILSGIVSYPELLLMDLPAKSNLRKPLELIKSSGEKAATVVQDLLTLARRGMSNFEIVNLNRVVTDFLESPELKKQQSFYPQVKLAVHLAGELDNIKGSAVHLSKTVMNLLANAFDATAGKGTVTLATQNQTVDEHLAEGHDVQPGAYTLLRVSDNGVGIAAEDLDRIFEPFYTKKVMGRGGTGLGMAVVWGTVSDHKGFIELSSQPGHGTRLDLYFPATQEIAMEQDGPLPVGVYKGRNETILIVDDVADQRVIATSILQRLGYQARSVSSGESALKEVKYHPVDLLILDMIMDPGMDGLDTYKAILAMNPKQKAIIASGYSETTRVKEALNLGASQYIKKPYSFENIGTAVRMALDTPFKPKNRK